MKLKLLPLCFALIGGICFAQVGIGTTDPHPSAILDLAAANKGFLLPRANLTGRNDNTTVSNPANGLLLFNLGSAGTGNNAVVANALYFRQTSTWQKFAQSSEVNVLEYKNQYVLRSTANQIFSPAQITSLNSSPANEVPLIWSAGEIFLDSSDDLELQADNQTIRVITAGSYRVLANFTFNPSRITTANNDNFSSVNFSIMVSKNNGVTWNAVSGAAMPYDVGTSNLIQSIIVPRSILKFEANDLIRVVVSKPVAPDFGTSAGIVSKATGDTTKLFRLRRLSVN